MDTEQAILALAGLAQPTRLEAFRRLVHSEPDGMPAGELAHALAVPQNTLSAHLAVLTRAGLVTHERRSRSIIYRANLDCVRGMALYLLKDCCRGRAEVCAPLIADLNACCAAPARARNRV